MNGIDTARQKTIRKQAVSDARRSFATIRDELRRGIGPQAGKDEQGQAGHENRSEVIALRPGRG